MNANRLVCFAAATVISAIQWAPLFRPAMYAQSVQAVSASVAADASDGRYRRSLSWQVASRD